MNQQTQEQTESDTLQSWIVTRKETGQVIGEFFCTAAMAARFNPDKVLVESAGEYLGRINAAIKAVSNA